MIQQIAAYPLSSSRLMGVSQVSDDLIFVADGKSSIIVASATGQVRWTGATANSGNTSNPPVAFGISVTYAGDKTMTVFEGANGTVRWSVNLDKTNTGLYGRRPTLNKDRIFLSSDAGITAYDIKNGSIVDPVLTDTGVYIFAKGKIYALSASTGKPLFAPITDAVTQICVTENALWYGISSNALVALSANTGVVLEKITTPAPVSGIPAVSPSGIIVPLANGQLLSVVTQNTR